MTKLAGPLISGIVFLYGVGLLIISQFLGSGAWKLVSEVELAVNVFFGAFIVVGASISIDALNPELLWIFKWRLVQGRPLASGDIRKILDGDQGLQAILNLFFGLKRAKLMTLYFALIKIGPPIGFSMLFSGYKAECDSPGCDLSVAISSADQMAVSSWWTHFSARTSGDFCAS